MTNLVLIQTKYWYEVNIRKNGITSSRSGDIVACGDADALDKLYEKARVVWQAAIVNGNLFEVLAGGQHKLVVKTSNGSTINNVLSGLIGPEEKKEPAQEKSSSVSSRYGEYMYGSAISTGINHRFPIFKLDNLEKK